MGRRSTKNPFDMLDKETMAAIDGGDEASINAKIADVAKNQAALEDAKKDDEQLKEAKLAAKEAGAFYSQGAKRNRQVVKYCRQVLRGKGKHDGDAGLGDPTPEPDQSPQEAADRQAEVDAKNAQGAA